MLTSSAKQAAPSEQVKTKKQKADAVLAVDFKRCKKAETQLQKQKTKGGLSQRPGGTWSARFHSNGKRHCIGGETKEIAAKKMQIVLKRIKEGSFDGDIHSLLKSHGYTEGAYLYPGGQNVPPKRKLQESDVNLASQPFLGGTIRERPDGRWEARYMFAKKRNSLYGRTEAEAKSRLLAVLVSIDDGSYVGKNKETVVGYMVSWLEVPRKTDLAPSTLKSYEMSIRNHITPFFKQKKLQDSSTENIQGFVNYLRTEGRSDGKEGGLSYKTALNIRNMLFSAFNYAINPLKLIRYNPVVGVKIKRPLPKSKRVLNEMEFDTLIKKCLALQTTTACAIGVLLYTGMRKGELLGLQYGDIDFSQGLLYVRHQLTRGPHPEKHRREEYTRVDTWAGKKTKTGLYLGPTKTPTSVRTIPIGEKAMEFLFLLKSQRESILGKSIEDCDHWQSMFLLVRDDGVRAVDPRTFAIHYDSITAAANLKDVNVHATRHTFVTHLIKKAPGELAVIAAIMGHADQGTTLMYSQTMDENKRGVINLLT